jgi:dienelactone hydrolase
MRNLIALCAGLMVATVLLATTAAVSADERVTFDSARYLVGSLQQKLARERGEPIKRAPAETIQGYLSKPAGAGPFPAVVDLHGCGGPRATKRMSAVEQFTGWGYVTLVVDSFTTRGIKNACTGGPSGSREVDAMGALVYLSKLPFVDPKRVAVVGYSQGGMVSLEVASVRPFDLFEMPRELKFKAAVAYYPLCSAAADELAIPTIIFIGAADDWAPPAECKNFMRRRDGKGAPVTLIEYPGAYHDFDIPGVGDGMRYFGHWLQYDAAADAHSRAAMRDFLARELSK